jgi:Large polyvalent protein associated domain 25
MNKQDLLNKLAAKQAAQVITEVEQTNVELSPLNYFQIHWSEAGSFHDGLITTNWEGANDAMKDLWNNISPQERTQCYHKTKVTIVWENGMKITDRLDLGTGGDFNPDECTIQDYIKDQVSVMYESNLQVGDRTKLSWSDSDTAAQQVIQDIEQTFEEQYTEPTNDIPSMLKQLIGIVETIEEANDSSDAALIKASEQIERCEFYITYLQSILPILKAKTNKMIEAKHVKKVSINVNFNQSHLN